MLYRRQKWIEQNEPPTTSHVFQCPHCGTWPGVWMLFGLCLQLLAPQRYACVGAGLLFKVLTGRVTRKGHGPLPATGQFLVTRSQPWAEKERYQIPGPEKRYSLQKALGVSVRLMDTFLAPSTGLGTTRHSVKMCFLDEWVREWMTTEYILSRLKVSP